MNIQSSLAKHIPSKVTEEELDAIKRDGWLTHGILVVAVNDPRLSWPQAQVVQQIGDRLHGKKRGR